MPHSEKANRETPTAPQRLVCGAHTIGYITVDSCDNFFLLGSFQPGPDYECYRQLFDRIRASQQQMDQLLLADEDDKYDAASDVWNDALDELNDLPLMLQASDGSNVQPIHDFQIDNHDRVEFKLD